MSKISDVIDGVVNFPFKGWPLVNGLLAGLLAAGVILLIAWLRGR